jgi:hypothetical protein
MNKKRICAPFVDGAQWRCTGSTDLVTIVAVCVNYIIHLGVAIVYVGLRWEDNIKMNLKNSASWR